MCVPKTPKNPHIDTAKTDKTRFRRFRHYVTCVFLGIDTRNHQTTRRSRRTRRTRRQPSAARPCSTSSASGASGSSGITGVFYCPPVWALCGVRIIGYLAGNFSGISYRRGLDSLGLASTDTRGAPGSPTVEWFGWGHYLGHVVRCLLTCGAWRDLPESYDYAGKMVDGY